jgi:hypothetical protein
VRDLAEKTGHPSASVRISGTKIRVPQAVRDDGHTEMTSPGRTAGYGSLLADTRFEGFLWAQFLGAFNDNVYKMIVSFTAVRIAVDSAASGRYLAIAGAVFIFPFILFSGYAGQLADRYSKTRMLQITKSLEIVTMLMG